MRVVHLSYARIIQYSDPVAWLKKINFFALLLEKMSTIVDVKSIHCINYSGMLPINNTEYHFKKLNRFQSFFPFLLSTYVKQLRPDIVLIHGFQSPVKVILLRWMLGSGVKIVVQHHAERPLRHYKKIAQKFVDKFVSLYFFTSIDQAKPWLKEGQIVDERKIIEVMEVPSVFYQIDRLAARLKTKVRGSKNYLWVGRLDANKDPVTLVAAFIEFAKSNLGAHLYIVFQSDELLDNVKSLVGDAFSVAEQITLVGKIEHEELLYWYNSVDFIISTSHYEGSGIAICEGISCGCIPILTNIPSFRMMTENGKCGLLYEAGRVNELTSLLHKSLSLDFEREREKVLTLYQRNLSAEVIARKMINAFEGLRT